MLVRLAQRIGVDYPSRCRRRLLPLWSDLTAACPEVIYRSPAATGSDSRFLLHRTVIEIRDCLRVLSRYRAPTPAPVADIRDELTAFAVQLARACAVKAKGESPFGGATAISSAAGDFGGEIAELTALAARWKLARAIATEHDDKHDPASVDPREMMPNR